MSNKYILSRYCYAINEIALPIYDFLGINNMSMRRFYKNGEQFYLSSSPKWLDYYFANNLHQIGAFTNFSSQESPYSLWQQHNSKDKKFWHVIKQIENVFALSNGFTINRIQTDYVDVFNFVTDMDNHQINSQYISHIPEIEKFIDYFLIVANKIIYDSSQYTFNVHKIHFVDEIHKQKAEFYNNINNPRLRFIEYHFKLSPREIQCIEFILMGYSCKSIANKLNLSPRTIEFYLQNCKRKMRISNNQQISDIFSALGQ